MSNINNTNFQNDIYEVLQQIIKDDLTTIRMKEKLIEGKNTPIEECIPEDDVEW